MKRIGIDVGGTNTDAVVIEGDQILGSIKTPTTQDITGGVVNALRQVLKESNTAPESLDAVMIGTTHFTNAVAQRRDLSKVSAIRICLPASASLEPFVDWPSDLADIVRGDIYMLQGGHEFDGRPIAEFDENGMREAARSIRNSGLSAVAITSVFSPLTSELEERAARILLEEAPDVSVTQSHTLGRIGLLERENATLLNASLHQLAKKTTAAFTEAMEACGISAILYLTQNDGTVMLSEAAQKFPVFSFASGPTNSMRGAAFLSHLSDAIVVDTGGTTADIGMLRNGFPREANSVVEIGGVRTLFRMPDLFSLAIGGGTLVAREPLEVGPHSVGYELPLRSTVFGGNEVTATDIAVAAGLIDLGDPDRVADFDKQFVADAVEAMRSMIADGVDRMKTEAADVPVIAVGGGAFLVPRKIPGVSEVIHVRHGEVANAVGAAIAQVSGECDQIFQNVSREQALAEARRTAENRAKDAGAEPSTIELVEFEDLPLAYMPGNSLRVRVRVVGSIG